MRLELLLVDLDLDLPLQATDDRNARDAADRLEILLEIVLSQALQTRESLFRL